MYNEDKKIAFIESITSSESVRVNLINMFNAIEKYEEAWGSDIYTKTFDEIKPVLEQITGFRSSSSKLRIKALKDYSKWCTDRGFAGAVDGMADFESLSGLEKFKTHTLSSPMHLQSYLDACMTAVDANTVDNTLRCFYWLAYGGMAEQDIFKTTCGDVDFRTMSVRYFASEIPIYREAVSVFRYCVESEVFNYEHPTYTTKDYAVIPRIAGSLLVRGCKAQPDMYSFRSTLSRRSKKALDSGKTNLEMSYYRVWLSGVFYRMYELEQIGRDVDFRPIVTQYMEAKVPKEEFREEKTKKKILSLIRDYKKDYTKWKEVYRK